MSFLSRIFKNKVMSKNKEKITFETTHYFVDVEENKITYRHKRVDITLTIPGNYEIKVDKAENGNILLQTSNKDYVHNSEVEIPSDNAEFVEKLFTALGFANFHVTFYAFMYQVTEQSVINPPTPRKKDNTKKQKL